MKSFAILAALIPAACTTQAQRDMRAANTAIESAWKSAAASDWNAAAASVGTVPGHVRAGVEARPIRRVNGADLDLRPILAGWESHAARSLTSATRSHDPARFDTALRLTLTQCTACHTATGKPETEIFQIPPRP